MNNGDNQTNQTIPGVRVAPPSVKPVDATTNDVGAANVKSSVVQPMPVTNTQPAVVQVPATPATSVPSVVQSATIPNQGASQPTNATSPNTAVTETVQNTDDGKKKKVKKPKNKLARFYFFIIILLIGGVAYLWYYHQQQMAYMDYKCTPVSTTEGSKELDLDSTIVQDLYAKVATTLREDLGGTELNDQMKVYLAFRQIPTSKMYDSNCNKFDSQGMEPFKCIENSSFTPKAFKEEALQLELKKLFGEDTNIANQNVQLGTSCIGGYQYIESRGEYVQGQCESTGTTLYSYDKELIGATSTESMIVLTERVKYYGNEGLQLSNKLVSGTYKYTFRLDMNYNYVLISKVLAE